VKGLAGAALLVLALTSCQSHRPAPSPSHSLVQSPSHSATPSTPRAVPEVLVMSGSGGTIFTVKVDGTHKRVLPPRGRTPSWTPDGRIIYVSAPRAQVWVMDADGSNSHQVGDLDLDEGNPIYKPQLAKNGLIAFTDAQGKPSRSADNPGPQNGTWVMRQDGSGLRMLVQHCTATSLALSGTWATCTKETNRHREIWRINTDGTGLAQLTFPTSDPGYPDGNASSISPDEKTIAFFSGKESDLGTGGFTQSVLTWGHRNVAVIASTGGARRTVTACTPVTTQAQVKELAPGGCLAADNPAWSPDGTRLIYDRGAPRRADGGTWEIDLDGQHNHRLWPDTRGAGNVPLS
jgi:Tol biopolymer transport system component